MTSVEFTVAGQPLPQGSSRAFVAGGKARIVSKTARLSDWRLRVGMAAAAAVEGSALWTGPLAVTLHFRPADRPASHYLPANARRVVRELRVDAPVWHAGTPDLDKLVRACLDAMTAVVYADDRQVARITATSAWPEPGEVPGVDITVRQLEATR